MRAPILSLTATGLTVACVLALAPAWAQNPPQVIAGILCDTEAQIRAIVTGAQGSDDGARSVFQRFHAERNAKNKPACTLGQVPHHWVSVPDSIALGQWPENGHAFNAFGLHIQTGEIDLWFLYVAARSADERI